MAKHREGSGTAWCSARHGGGSDFRRRHLWHHCLSMLLSSLRSLGLAPFLILVAGCGGKVVFDGVPGESPGGQGGHGGAGGSSASAGGRTGAGGATGQGGAAAANQASSGVNGSTTTGPTPTGPTPACSCTEICAKLGTCGFMVPNCEVGCGMATPAQQQCFCDLPSNCQGAQNCINQAAGSSSSGGSGSGGFPSQACSQCRVMAAQGPCSSDYQACKQNPECNAIRQCHQQCGYDVACVAQCDEAHPSGQAAYQAYLGCAVCGTCMMQCASDAIYMTYCSGGL